MLNKLLSREEQAPIRLHIIITTLHGDLGDIVLEDTPDFRLRLHHASDTILMLVTLAHELIHLSQVVKGRLKFRKFKGLDVWVWDGKSYGSDPYDDPDRTLPWESDANNRESDLARQFLNKYVRSLNG